MHAQSLGGRIASLWLCMLVGSGLAHPTRALGEDDSYEVHRLRLFLDSAGLEEDPQPEGKTIRYVRIERRQVLEPDDLLVPVLLPRFASTWTNVFHWLSEESTVRRELLLRAGEPFRQAFTDESARNLRDLHIFSLVNVVAVKTRDPASVGVIVYTRDLWSLRFEQVFDGAGSSFSLGGQLIERNFLGRNKWLGVRATLSPLTYTVGQTYLDPRVFQQELRADESFDLIFNRTSGRVEGSTGTFRFGRPFYNLAQRTSVDLLAYYLTDVHRTASGAQVLGVPMDPSLRGERCLVGPDTCIPSVWDERRLQLEAAGHYRVGERYKQTYTLGAALLDKHFAANRETNLRPDQVEIFRSVVLPKSRRDVYPYVRYRLSLPRFMSFTNLASFGRSESVQVGPSLDGQIGVPLRAYGASNDGLIVRGLMAYVWADHDALLDVAGEGLARLEQGNVVDQQGVLRLRAATPSYRGLWGRLVVRGIWDVHHNDTQRSLVALGGDKGLRGFRSQEFVRYGASRVLYNLEYRTRPWLLQSVHVGLVAFYDAGSVYERLARIKLHHSLGAGLRVLLPQFNRYAFRLDVGFPLEQKSYAVLLSYGGDQVIALTPEDDAFAVAGGRQSLAP